MHLVIDGKNRAKAGYHIGGKLRSSTGLQTGLACNLFSQIKKLLETHTSINRVYFLWEGQHTWRHDIFPEYKGDRVYVKPEGPEEPDANNWPQQVALMQAVLETLPFRYCISPNLEADDIAGILARNATEKTLLVSDDYDYLQLVRSGVVAVYQPKSIMDPVTKISKPKPVITVDNMSELLDYRSTEEVIEIFSICGDKGDGIPGVVGVAEKGAKSYLRGEMKSSSQKYKDISNWKDNPNGYERSRTLFDMNRIPEQYLNNYTTEIREFDEKGFRALVEKMEWGTVLKNWDRWVALFRRLEQ